MPFAVELHVLHALICRTPLCSMPFAVELAEVGPMLEEAAEAVTGISRRDLTEIANLLNPPALVKLTLEVRILHVYV